jgi:hypothetical protein
MAMSMRERPTSIFTTVDRAASIRRHRPPELLARIDRYMQPSLKIPPLGANPHLQPSDYQGDGGSRVADARSVSDR